MKYPDLILKQYVYEAQNWQRILSFMQQENVSFKTRLAEVVSGSLPHEDLDKAETFQDDFFSQDRIHAYLSKEIQKQVLQLNSYTREGADFEKVSNNQKELRDCLHKTEALFSGAREAFVAYLQKRFKVVC